MRTLAIDCATEACSVALLERGVVIGADYRVLGRGHAEHLVPMIAALPDRGRAQRILVSLGPGSFTGVRIGVATAKALGFAWSAHVLGYPTLALVAAMARATHPGPVSVCMTGGHGEWFIQDFADDGLPEAPLASVAPVDAAGFGRHAVVAGSQARAKGASDGRIVLDILPDARCVAAIPPELLTETVAPIYGRGPDARLPA
jgi:tRNA threonylcarbamoyladenosine biosynthesis protein TsaB